MKLLLISALVVLTSPVFGSVAAYFNQTQSSSYIDPYRNISRYGDNLEQVLLDQIKPAKKSIFIAVQEFRLPLVAEALIKKQSEGVDVRIVLENDYNFDVTSQQDSSGEGEYEASKLTELRAFVDINKNGKIEKSELEARDAVYMLKAANIPVMDDTHDSSKGAGLMHHKFMVVDGKSTVVSSANFTMSCMHGDMLAPSSRGNANSMITVQSLPFSNLFVEEFGQLWGNGKRGNFGHNKTYRGPQTVTVRGIKLTVQFSPTSERYNWEESVNGLIAEILGKASQSIKAALFVFSDQMISDVMEERQQAGAKIGVMIEPKFAYRDYSELLDMMGLQMFNSKCSYEADNHPWKVPAKEVGMGVTPRGDVIHHKFAVVDGKTVIMGSQNWSNAANYINDETLVVIEAKGISDLYTQEYERIRRTALIGPTPALMKQIKEQEKTCVAFGRNF